MTLPNGPDIQGTLDLIRQRFPIGTDDIAVSAITSALIADGTITDTDLAANTLSAALPNWGTWYGSAPIAAASGAASFTNSYFTVQIEILSKVTITGVGYWVGGTASGNVRTGLYNSAGTRVAAKTADVAQAAANTFQQVAFDSTYAAVPGVYFVAVIFSSATATLQEGRGMVPSSFVPATGTMVLPTTITVPTTPVAGAATIAATTY